MAPFDPASYSDFAQGRIKHIDFQIGVDFSAQVLNIVAVYHIDRPVTSALDLDSAKINLRRAHADGRDIHWEFAATDDYLGTRLRLTDLNGATQFTLEFSTSPEAAAVQWLAPAQTAGGRHPFLYTQCQDIHARSVFPCQDSPSIRFTYSAEVTAPEGLIAVMAAEPLPAGSGSGEFFFTMPQPIPSYLFGLAVGELVFQEIGPRSGIYAEPKVLDSAVWEFAGNEQVILETEKLLGPYLWGRYDLLILPPSFPFGGMENPRLTFITPTAILGTRGQANLITHELAHAWTGNLVTNATWQDFWLNEGWTTYAENRISEILEGKDANDLHLVHEEHNLLEAMGRVGMDAPDTCLKVYGDGRDAHPSAFGVAYYKGYFFLRECELAVGRAKFDPFVLKYMAAFQFQSITTETFLDFFKTELPEVFEKVDVNAWVYKPGMPANRTRPQSALFDAVSESLRAYENGTRPTLAQVQGWRRDQILTFLGGLPNQIPVDDCKYFESIFELEKRNDGAFFSAFYAICINSGYTEILPRVREFMSRIGRMLYLAPVLRALTAADWSRGQARALVDEVRAVHHPVSVAAMERVLKMAGL